MYGDEVQYFWVAALPFFIPSVANFHLLDRKPGVWSPRVEAGETGALNSKAECQCPIRKQSSANTCRMARLRVLVHARSPPLSGTL